MFDLLKRDSYDRISPVYIFFMLTFGCLLLFFFFLLQSELLNNISNKNDYIFKNNQSVLFVKKKYHN